MAKKKKELVQVSITKEAFDILYLIVTKEDVTFSEAIKHLAPPKDKV